MIYFISVVNDFELYKKFVSKNNFIKNCSNIKLTNFDNSKENVFISKRYNEFLNNYDFSQDAWFVFCHSDWELLDDIEKKLASLDDNKIYGPIGEATVEHGGKYYKFHEGCCYERKRDGSEYRKTNIESKSPRIVDSLDCQALFVHSSLVKKYKLRFDETLQFDLYIEDFCINSKLKYNIETNVIDIKCCHWSNAGYAPAPQSYYNMLEYLNEKYPNDIFGGTVSFIGGKDVELASDKERLFYKLRNNILNKNTGGLKNA